MELSICKRAVPRARAWLCALAVLIACPVAGAELNLPAAESLALERDPSLYRLVFEREALEELAVAAGELPDPVARVGAMSLPVDSFELDQEPMSQVLAGVVQRFPRGRTRELERRQMEEKAVIAGHDRAQQRLAVVLAVREGYLDVMLQRRLQALTADARAIFGDLADITRDYYATGRAQQQDALQAEVEFGRLLEREGRFEQAEREARARLAVYVGDAAYDQFPSSWPALPEVAPLADLQAGLTTHPRILARRQEVAVAETGVALAEQRYRPEFAVDLSYGYRTGSDAFGASRPDLLSAMVVMDLPLFHDDRQDRVKAALLARASAAAFARDDAHRELQGELQRLLAAREEVARRRELFETVLLPQAEFSAQASFDAYQSAVGDLTALMRARITEFELGLDHARVEAEALRIQARLLFLQGETR